MLFKGFFLLHSCWIEYRNLQPDNLIIIVEDNVGILAGKVFNTDNFFILFLKPEMRLALLQRNHK